MNLYLCSPEPYHAFLLNLEHYEGHGGAGSSRSPGIVLAVHLGPKRTL